MVIKKKSSKNKVKTLEKVKRLEKIKTIKTIKKINENESIITLETEPKNKTAHEIGIDDPNGFNINPLTNEPYKNLYKNEYINVKGEKVHATYSNIAKNWSNLIVYKNKDVILKCIQDHQVTLATAGTGIGKTVIIPKIALHAFDYKENVICCIPKRIITRNTAIYAAKCLDVVIGEQVGYAYKGEKIVDKNGVKTKLTFCTTGTLIARMTGSDPTLKDYKCIVIDEAHERNIKTDELLLLIKKALEIRKDLKIVIMSATIDLDSFRNYYPKSHWNFGEVHAGNLTSYNIREHWLSKRPDDWKTAAIYIVMNILETTVNGDILIFVRAGSDAVSMCDQLSKFLSQYKKAWDNAENKGADGMSKVNPYCVKLESGLTNEESDLAITQYKYKDLKDENGDTYSRKVVISTNVAESSITVEGVVFVIDSGLEFVDGFEPRGMVNTLMEHNVSQSGAIQRKGRAGRTQDGECFHLYSKDEFNKFNKYPIPDIQKSNLTEEILNLMRLKYINNIKDLKALLNEFISPPHISFVNIALRSLSSVDAISFIGDEGRITPLGKAISRFSDISVNLARSIIASYYYGCARQVCEIVAMAAEARGRMNEIYIPFKKNNSKTKEYNLREEEKFKKAISKFKHDSGDYMACLKIMDAFKRAAGLGNYNGIAVSNGDKDEEELGFGDDNTEDMIKDKIPQNGVGRQWCRENCIRYNKVMMAYKKSQMLYKTLLDVVKPRSGGMNGGKDISKRQIELRREGEFKLERNIHLQSNVDDNILLSLALGHVMNMAKLNKSVGLNNYISCFAENKIPCKIASDSLINKKMNNEIVMFYEIFQSSNDIKSCKLNMVNIVPYHLLEIVKSRLSKNVAYCI